jgi:hypothetical protein
MVVLSPRNVRRAKLAALVAVLWISYLAAWPAVPYAELCKPTLIAVTFAVSGELLGVATLPVVVVFCLAFFAHDLVVLYSIQPPPDGALATLPWAYRHFMFLWETLLLSPITLWGPLLCGMVAFALTRTILRGKPPEQPGWGR